MIVLDAKTSVAGRKELLNDIAEINPKPVTTVILHTATETTSTD